MACDALDRHRLPPVEHAVFDGNVKVRIRHEDHLEKWPKTLRVQRLWITGLRPSSSIEDLQRETLRMLVTSNVKMLIIDEIHHVLAGPLLKQRHFLNVIKYVGNELQIPLVAAGTRDVYNAIQIDPQLANRFEPALLPRWSMNEDYLRLLASFEPALRLEQPSNPIEPVLATKILSLSGGTIGEISTLLTRAASRAIDDGSERMTGATLDACGYVAPSERRRVALGT